jgi:MFS family permease
MIGDALYAVARPRLILSDGDNAEALGIVLTVYGIPSAWSMLLGGWLSDRLRPRRSLKPVWSGRSSFRVAGPRLRLVMVFGMTQGALREI